MAGSSLEATRTAPRGPTAEDDDRVARAVDEYVALSGDVFAAVAPCWTDVHLTLPQIRALFLLSRRDAMTIGQLGRHLGVGVPAASHLVERLLRDGLVRRRADR